ncbi:NAD(P)-dependent oxidoreductase [Caldalkalibacillus mannanilyticus]|uniref:NAD(P)-dependent oxidoreductase n=1 Tax=Caldalkalibacillus mannanilyticus TaxID=1418 RepID=UPI000A412B38|nr:NAD(P)-dependent oxidoreductase [Caldalkalibacillus mannanilyticus]
MKVIILDDWEKHVCNQTSISRLREHFEVEIYHDKPTKEILLERLQKADIVIPIRERTRFSKELLQEMRNVKYIAQTGSGLAHIDMDEVNRLQMIVSTTPGGSNAVVELVVAFMLAYSRKIIPLHHKMKEGIWQETIGFSLEDKTIGIIGLGKIGAGVARIAQAFNMKVVAWGPRLTEERAKEHGVEYCSLEQLLKRSDYLSLHVRLVPETTHLLKADHFDMMKKEACLINTSRGEVIDEEALIQALRENKIGGAGLDVFTQEPISSDHPSCN